MSMAEQHDWATNHFSDKYENYSNKPNDNDAKQEAIEANQLFHEHLAEQDAANRFDDKSLSEEEQQEEQALIEEQNLRRFNERREEGSSFTDAQRHYDRDHDHARQIARANRSTEKALGDIDDTHDQIDEHRGIVEPDKKSADQDTPKKPSKHRYRFYAQDEESPTGEGIVEELRRPVDKVDADTMSHNIRGAFGSVRAEIIKRGNKSVKDLRMLYGTKARVTPRGTVTGHLTDAIGRERCIQEGRVVPCPDSTYTPRVDERQRPSTNQKGIKSEDEPDKVHRVLDYETDLADAHFRIMPGDFTEARAKRDARNAQIEEARRQYDQKGIKAQRPHKGKAPRVLEGERFNAQAQQTFPTNDQDVQEGQRKEREINDEVDSQWIEAEMFRPSADYEAHYDENDFKRMKGKALSANNALAGGSLVPPSVQGRFVQTNRNRSAITPPTVAKRKAFGPPHSHTDSQKRDYHQPIGDPNVPNVHRPHNYEAMSPAEQNAYDETYDRRHTRPSQEEIEQSEGKAIPSDPREPSESIPYAEEIDLSEEPLPSDSGEVRRAQSRPRDLQAPSVPPRRGDRKPIHIPPDKADDLVQGERQPQESPPVTEVPQLEEGRHVGPVPSSPAMSAAEEDNVIDPNEWEPSEGDPRSVRSPEASAPSTGPGNPTIHVDEIARLMSQGELDQYAAEDMLSDLNALNEDELMEVYDRLVNEDFDAAFPGQTDELLNIIDGVEKLIKFKKPRLDADVQALNNPVELQSIVKSTPVKQSLAQANVVDMQRTGKSGANTSYIYTLDNGEKGVFKPQYGEKPGLRGNIPGAYYVREVASSEVAEVLGMDDLLPSTVFRKDHDKIGSIQNFINGVTANDLGVDDRYDGEDDLSRSAAYDYLVGNTDRHDGNWMITNDGRLGLIDNGLSFPTTNSGESFGNCDLIFKAAIDNLTVPPIVQEWYNKWDQIESILRVRGVEEEAIYAMADRLQSLVNIGDFKGLIRSGNWTDLQQWFY